MIKNRAALNSIKQCRVVLEKDYGTAFKGLIAYGSVARGDDEPGSDVDLLVLIEKNFNYFDEIKHVIDKLYVVQLESDYLLSVKPMNATEYRDGDTSFINEVRKEGVLI